MTPSTTNLEALAPKTARELTGLDTAALAALVPCSRTTVYACENAGEYPRHRHLRDAYIAALRRAMKSKRLARPSKATA